MIRAARRSPQRKLDPSPPSARRLCARNNGWERPDVVEWDQAVATARDSLTPAQRGRAPMVVACTARCCKAVALLLLVARGAEQAELQQQVSQNHGLQVIEQERYNRKVDAVKEMEDQFKRRVDKDQKIYDQLEAQGEASGVGGTCELGVPSPTGGLRALRGLRCLR